MSLQRFEDRVAVITGGGSGIGLATARRLASEGAKVIIADVNAAAGKAAADEVDGEFVATDVTSEAQVRALFETTVDRFGSLDVAFNNAGISPPEDDSILTTCVAEGAAGQPDLGLPVLQVRDSADAAPGKGLDRQHRVLRRRDGRGDVADLLHCVEGWRAGNDPRAGCAVRQGGDPG
jgi:NAD(P)-dependent dehydrogenase (short-subunit alcohol dehydrogenase family)